MAGKHWKDEELRQARDFIRGRTAEYTLDRSIDGLRSKFKDEIWPLTIDGFDRLPREIRHELSKPFMARQATQPVCLGDVSRAHLAVEEFRTLELKLAICRGDRIPKGDVWAAAVRAALYEHGRALA